MLKTHLRPPLIEQGRGWIRQAGLFLWAWKPGGRSWERVHSRFSKPVWVVSGRPVRRIAHKFPRQIIPKMTCVASRALTSRLAQGPREARAPPASAASLRRSRPCSTISVSITPWSTTQLTGSSDRWRMETRARRQPWVTQVRKLLDAPPEDTLNGVRDRVILATLLYYGMRHEELCRLRGRDIKAARQCCTLEFFRGVFDLFKALRRCCAQPNDSERRLDHICCAQSAASVREPTDKRSHKATSAQITFLTSIHRAGAPRKKTDDGLRELSVTLVQLSGGELRVCSGVRRSQPQRFSSGNLDDCTDLASVHDESPPKQGG